MTYQLFANDKQQPVHRMTRYTDSVVNYCKFTLADADEPLEIEILAAQDFADFTLSPEQLELQPFVAGNRMKLKVERAHYLVLRASGLEDLFILIDQPQICPKNRIKLDKVDRTGKEDVAEKLNSLMQELAQSGHAETFHLPAGTYLSSQLTIPSNITLFLDEDALLMANPDARFYPNQALLYFENVHDAAIKGLGTIDGKGRLLRPQADIQLLKIKNCARVTIDGLLERDSAFWCNHVQESHDISFRNLKVINYRPAQGMANTDGLNFDSSHDCSLENGFFYTGDDNCTVKGTVFGGESHHILFKHFLGYSNSAACKIGTETLNDTISDVRFEAVDVVACDRALVICGFDRARISDVCFSDIQIENIVPQGIGAEKSRFIDFRITDNTWRTCVGECRIENVSLQDISLLPDSADFSSRIEGRTAEYAVQNLNFKQIKVKHQPIFEAKSAHIFTNEWVKNIKFEDKMNDTVEINGQVTDFKGEVIANCDVMLYHADFTPAYQTKSDTFGFYCLDKVEKGNYLALYALNLAQYPRAENIREEEMRLEFWAWNVIADRNLVINPRYDRLELYGTHVFKVYGGYKGYFVYFRPMSLSKTLAYPNYKNKIEMEKAGFDVSVKADDLTVKVFADEEELKINSITAVEEYVGNHSLTGFIVQVDEPMKVTKFPFILFRVEAEYEKEQEKGENIYFYEKKNFK